MGLINANHRFYWWDICRSVERNYHSSSFDEHTAVSPGIVQESNNGRGVNTKGSAGVISNGSKILFQKILLPLSLVSLVSRKLLQNQVDMNTKMVRAVFLIVMD